MSTITLTICGRPYEVRCRDGEEESLQKAAALVDEKSREAIAGLGTLSESRQFFFAALLLADQLNEKHDSAPPRKVDETVLSRAEGLATWLESMADSLEAGDDNP